MDCFAARSRWMSWPAWICTLALVTNCGPDPSRQLRDRLEARIADSGAESVGVYMQDLETDARIAIDANALMHAASTMKLAVLIQVFRDVDDGRLRLDDGIAITNSFHSIVDGTQYRLSPTDDSDSALYDRIGDQVPLGELADRMITLSSNLATNTLIELVGAERANATAHALGADSIQVLRGVEDIKAYEAGLSNRITAADMGVLLTAIARAEAASEASCRAMIDILSRQHFNDGLPAGLPPGTRVAHKTGWITGIKHDGGIVYRRDGGRHVLVVLTRGIGDPAVADRLIADLSRLVHDGLAAES
jgi:beta-lactamase class A